MTNSPLNTIHNVPLWLVRLCKRIVTVPGFILASLLNVVLSLIATLLLTAKGTDYSTSPLLGFIQHWYIVLIAFIILMCILIPIWSISKLPEIPSAREIKKRYLRRQINETQDLAIEGIPLLPPHVRLDEVFIPMQLYPHQSTIDQLLTEQQKKLLRSEMQQGRLSTTTESVLIDYERQHELLLRKGDRTSIGSVWQSLTPDHPAAVIQGFPGMGKSTLLLRLTLYMARRGLGENDPFGNQYTPLLVPIFIRLREYATYIRPASINEQAKDTSIMGYLASGAQELDALRPIGTLDWLKACLERGQCLVLFDGLDEVSDLADRLAVQDGIRTFINSMNTTTSTTNAGTYNRFLITSRVAGYDQNAFPAYLHYTIAELEQEQISEFLPRWCRASVQGDQRGNLGTEDEAFIASRASEIEQQLNAAMQSNQGIRELVENPFLLTLLAVMQQNGIELPRRRVELYTTLTEVLLETRNARRGLPLIPTAQAVQRLGPIAYQMQQTKNSFMTKNEVLASIAQTIRRLERISPAQAEAEATAFLQRVRERGGIFVLRTGDYLGFFHRTFQEYFAARDLVQPTMTKKIILDLVAKARQLDDLWREPFLLAVAYDSNAASEIIQTLLQIPQGTSYEQRAHDILLAGTCLAEAKESTIPNDLEREIVQQLIQIYAEAMSARDNDTLDSIQALLQTLLISVSKEARNSMLLRTLQSIIIDTSEVYQQRAVLTLLTNIAQQLLHCEDIVFEQLVPPLLGLTELPAIGNFQPMKPATPPDLAVVDLALAALTFIGARGPAGSALQEHKAQFETYLPLLAEYSLSSGTLLTPVVVPLDEQNFQRYRQAIEQWQQLYHRVQQRTIDMQKAQTDCTAILQTTLDCAEELTYPACTHFLAMLHQSQNNTTQDWRACWQDYLHEQMEQGTYSTYQVCAKLYTTLFNANADQQLFAQLIQNHFHSPYKQQRYAQRFLLTLVSDLRYLSDLSYFSYFIYLIYLIHLRYFIYLRYLSYFSYLIYFSDLSDLRYLSHLSHLSHLSYLSYLSYLSEIILTKDITKSVVDRLHKHTDIEKAELLSLLLGRVLQISEGKEMGSEVTQEIRTIAQTMLPFVLDKDGEVQTVVLDTISRLPARTKEEIIYVISIAQNADSKIQKACGVALERAHPAEDDAKAWKAIEDAQRSGIEAISSAAKARQ